MIRRLLILTAVLAMIAAAACLLSEVWQFGHVGAWRTIGLRESKLWYVSRTTPIADGEGFYIDAASEVNRAMFAIRGGARWWEEPLLPPALLGMAFVAYAFIAAALRRKWKRPAPRALIVTLFSICTLLAALWTTSRIIAITYDGPSTHLFLADGEFALFVEPNLIPPSSMRGDGWAVHTGYRPFLLKSSMFLRFNAGRFHVNAPLGMLLLILVVPAIVLAREDPKTWIGLCKQCRYDLTGNVTGVCPECGTEMAKAETQKAETGRSSNEES